MALTNSNAGYGTLTKVFHWSIVILFAMQYLGGNIMTAIGFNSSFAGIDTNTYYNWHKSLGLVALAIAVVRLINRQLGELPPWAPTSFCRAPRRTYAPRSRANVSPCWPMWWAARNGPPCSTCSNVAGGSPVPAPSPDRS